jgi:hypothetical protein
MDRQPPSDLFDIEDTLLRIALDWRYRAVGVLTGLVLVALSAVRFGPPAAEAVHDLASRPPPLASLYGSGEPDRLATERARAMAASAPGSPAARGLLGDDFWDELRRLEDSS